MAQKHIVDSKEYPMTREGRTQGPSRRYRRLRHPSFVAALWTQKNPLLQRGEIGYEVDTHKVKIGDGVTYWNDLAYIDAAGGTWGEITGDINDQTDLKNALDGLQTNIDGKVSKAGDTMSGPLTFTNTPGAGGIFGYTNGVVFYYMDGDTRTQLAALNDQAFVPYVTDTLMLGASNLKWKEVNATSAFISTVYTPKINNGADIAVPATGGTMALTSDLNSYVLKTGDQMTGTFWLKGYLNLRNQNQTNSLCWCAGSTNDRYKWGLNSDRNNVGFQYDANLRALMPLVSGAENLGRASYKWNRVYASYLDSSTGGNKPITIPQKMGTMALMDDVELAAQSGRMLTDQGVWYAKMDALGTIPASAEVEGRNYADFTQVDGNNDPIIVIYTYTSGAWVQTETITPPAAYDGYVPITSKIWDIPEQTGQQGGRILWNHTSKDFTPYPLIISFDGANITNGAFQGSADLSGTSTVTMPVAPSSTQIVNKDYVDTAIAAIPSGAFDLFDIKWRDSTTSNTAWALSDGNWINKADAETAYAHLLADLGPQAYGWLSASDTRCYTTSEQPEVGDDVYQESGAGIPSTPVGTITAVAADYSSITFGGVQFNRQSVYDTYFDQQSETVAGTTIYYFRASDGHKITRQGSNANTIYAATGVAWYYVLDTANQRFKLPRTQFAFVGTRGNLGDYVEPGLPNITGAVGYTIGTDSTATGAFTKDADTNSAWWQGSTNVKRASKFHLDASKSSAIYGNSTTVQAPATEMYLYFYVG